MRGLWITGTKLSFASYHRFVDLSAEGTTVSINDLIDGLIEECAGDVHGALKALLLLNERLEAELQHLYELTNLAPPEYGTVH